MPFYLESLENRPPRLAVTVFVLLLLLCRVASARAQTASTSDAMAAYNALHAFALDGGRATVSNLLLKRDRVEMRFTGTFYFAKPLAGRTTGAVFIGQGSFRAEPPDSLFERENLQRILKAESVESDFETAVLRFTDDSQDAIGAAQQGPPVAPAVQARATEFDARMLKETGVNAASRLLVSLREHEQPGVFIAQFDGGRRGRFTFVMDYQCRIPATNFGINGGEKGLVFFYERRLLANTVWLAFHAVEDYGRGTPTYADVFDLVEAPAYRMTVDVRDPRTILRVGGQIDLVAKARVSTIPFALSESLSEYDNVRLDKSMRVKAARVDGSAVEFIQEDWEGGFTLLLPVSRREGEAFSVEFETAGDFIRDQTACDCHVPLSNTEWYPRHGFLGRSTFDISFLHRKKHRVASGGVRLSDSVPSGDEDAVTTVYRLQTPVSFVTFAVGAYKAHTKPFTLQPSGEVPLEFFSMPNRRIDEDFILGEMGRAIGYFSDVFGAYPYPVFRAAFHPFGFGQALASFLMIPNATRANRSTYMLVAHETAHQWWGNVVAWRSYRDQWLSEGFAEYSSLLYTAKQDTPAVAHDLLARARSTLKEGPRIVRGGGGTGTRTGIGDGKVTDIGPLVLGQRLNTIESANAYQRLIYNKGALVLRMLHFLLADASTGEDQPFFDMMTDFVSRHRDLSATTESFARVAGEHFARSPMAQQFALNDLDWFFEQWVWQTSLPTYRLEYALENQPDGKVRVTGTLFQENAPDSWAMPLPVVFKLGSGTSVHALVLARGPRQPVSLTLPARPESVELDPDMWVLSEKTSSTRMKE